MIATVAIGNNSKISTVAMPLGVQVRLRLIHVVDLDRLRRAAG